jgi:hypothetical protein
MSDTALSRRQHLLALAMDAERKADRYFSEVNYKKGEAFRQLAAAYRSMAKEAEAS